MELSKILILCSIVVASSSCGTISSVRTAENYLNKTNIKPIKMRTRLNTKTWKRTGRQTLPDGTVKTITMENSVGMSEAFKGRIGAVSAKNLQEASLDYMTRNRSIKCVIFNADLDYLVVATSSSKTCKPERIKAQYKITDVKSGKFLTQKAYEAMISN